MRRPRLKVRSLLLLVPLTGLLIWAGLRGMRGSQYAFNVVVSRAVPKGGSLARLEAVAGLGVRPSPTDRLAAALRRRVERNRSQFPDGWHAGDFWVYYDFPEGHRWWFQVRGGRLVNYDPAVLAGQPQQAVSGIQ